MNLQFGDVFLVSRRGIIGELVKWHTHSIWTHAAIIIRPTGSIIEATSPTVRYYNLYQYLDKGYRGAVLRLKDNSTFDEYNGFQYLFDKIGMPYDYKGFLSFLLNKKVGNKSYFFCSELVYEFYKRQGKIITRMDSDFFSPGDLWKNPLFDVVWEIK